MAHIAPNKFNEDDFTEVNHVRAMEEELDEILYQEELTNDAFIDEI